MSNRMMAGRYSQAGGGYGGGEGLLGLIAELTGANNVTGGPSVDATGNISATPYAAKGGFLGGRGRNTAMGLNAQLFGPVMQEQEAGRQTRETEKARSSLAIEEAKKKAIIDLLKANGLSPTEANEVWKSGKLDPILQQITEQTAQGNLTESKTRNEVLASPGGKKAIGMGVTAKAAGLDPNKIGGSANQNSVTAFPDVPNWDLTQLHGPTNTKNTTATTMGGVYDPVTKQMVGGKPVVTETDISNPGRMIKPISQESRDAVTNPALGVNPTPSGMQQEQPQDIVALMQALGGGQQAGGMQGLQPAGISAQPSITPPASPMQQGPGSMRGNYLMNILQQLLNSGGGYRP